MPEGYTSSPGWYPDPSGVHQLRYFSTSWTDHVSNGGVVTNSSLSQPAPPTAPVVGWPTPFAAPSYAASPSFAMPPGGGSVNQPFYGVVGHPLAGQPAPASRVKSRGAVLVLVGGILMAIGPLFAWETVSASGIYAEAADVKGTAEGAGPVVLASGIVVAVLAALVLTGSTSRRKVGIATLIISVVSVVFCFGNWNAISNDIDKAPSGVDANIGIGLIFAVVGCLLAAIASIGMMRRRT